MKYRACVLAKRSANTKRNWHGQSRKAFGRLQNLKSRRDHSRTMNFERSPTDGQANGKESLVLQPLRGWPPQRIPRGFAFRRWIESRGTCSGSNSASSYHTSNTRMPHSSHSTVMQSSGTHASFEGNSSHVRLGKVKQMPASTRSVIDLPTEDFDSVADERVFGAPVGEATSAGRISSSHRGGSGRKKKEHAILRKLKRIERRVRRVKRSRQELQQEVTECLQTLRLLQASRALASNVQAEAEATSALRAYVSAFSLLTT